MNENPLRDKKALEPREGLSSDELKRLESTYGASATAVIVLDDQGIIVFANDAAQQLFNQEGSKRLRIDDLCADGEGTGSDSLAAVARRALRAPDPAHFWRGPIAGGSDQQWEVHFVSLPLSEKRAYVLGQFHHDGRAPSEAIRQNDTSQNEGLRLRAVLEHMPMAVMLFDRSGRVLDLNLQARAIAARKSWSRLGEDDHPFVVCDRDGRRLPREEWPLLRAVKTGEGCEDEEFVLDFGEVQRNVSITVIPILEDRGIPSSFLAIGEDITHRHEENRRKDEFLSVASHELRSPLTPLAGFIHLSRRQAESAKPVDPELLRRAEAQVSRLSRLIDDLLDLSRLDTGSLPINRKEICLTRLVERVMDPWLSGPERGRIHVALPEEEIVAHLDPDRIDQVLTNVVDNALKHGRSDGAVYISLQRQTPIAQISIRDEGDGMPKEDVERAFDRFYILRSDAPMNSHKTSMGLGLYIARQIVEGHEGTIEIESSLGNPTTVTITLPVLGG